MFTCNFNDNAGTATLHVSYVEPTFQYCKGEGFLVLSWLHHKGMERQGNSKRKGFETSIMFLQKSS